MVFADLARMLAHKPKAHGPDVSARNASPRVHIVGAGAMGARHARVFAAAGASVTVEDADPAKARAVAAETGARAVASGGTSGAGSEAPAELVVVATPTLTHAEIASRALAAGSHVLVEKPLAATLPTAERLAQAAIAAHRFLFVGMSERFHPVVRALRARVDASEITLLSFRRFGAGSSIQPALLNLGVHDVDLALLFFENLEATSTGPADRELRLETARAIGKDGALLHLSISGAPSPSIVTATRAPAPRERRLEVLLASGDRLEGDLLAPSLHLYKAGSATPEVIDLPSEEPLLLQAEAALTAIAGHDIVSTPLASAANGTHVLRIVDDAMGRIARDGEGESEAARAHGQR